MRLKKPGEMRRPDPAFNLLDTALHDSAVILEAYGRFATALIGTLLFPYATLRPVVSAPQQADAEAPSPSRRRGIISVLVALLVGAVLGRSLSGRRPPPSR
jgi:hypothetical protein